MTTNQPKRFGASLSVIIAGGVIGLIAIISRPADIQAATRVQPHAESEAPSSLMINDRPVLGELQSETERTVILGGEDISYLDAGPGGELFESSLDRDGMFAGPMRLMLVDLPDSW